MQSGVEPESGDGQAQARKDVSIPAKWLIVVGIMGAFFSTMAMGRTLLGVSLELAGVGVVADMERELGLPVGAFLGADFLFALLGLLGSAFVVFGGQKMMNLRSRGMAIGASIVGMVPSVSCCCVLGIPVGIWCLVILNKAHVRNAFAQSTPSSEEHGY